MSQINQKLLSKSVFTFCLDFWKKENVLNDCLWENNFSFLGSIMNANNNTALLWQKEASDIPSKLSY